MLFLSLLVIVTFAISASAAFFSVYGLTQIFSGQFLAVAIMGVSLEAGKLLAASYVYRYRKNMPKLLKYYLNIAILVLMFITSIGIYGFLSAAYQSDVLDLKTLNAKISTLEIKKDELSKIKTEKLERKKQIDADIASLPNNFVTGRQRLMKSYGKELEALNKDIDELNKQLQEITEEIAKYKEKKITMETHVGPIVFIAKSLGVSVDDSTKWLIFLIVFVFDPLAVALTLAINHGFMLYKQEKEKNKNNDIELKKEKVDENKNNEGIKTEKIDSGNDKNNDKNDEIITEKDFEEEIKNSITELKNLVSDDEEDFEEEIYDIEKEYDKLSKKSKNEMTEEERRRWEMLEDMMTMRQLKDRIRDTSSV